MNSRWSDTAAQQFVAKHPHLTPVQALRVYSAQLIGQDPALVLHGGGNTSAKGDISDALGRKQRVMWIKGSGGNLASMGPEGHPAVKLNVLEELRSLSQLADEAMVNELRLALLEHTAPTPSIEALVHAFLPHIFVDHTHADAILALVNQPNAAELCQKIYGKRFAIIPWIMPGFKLSQAARAAVENNPKVEGLLLLQHGIFTFGETAKQSYERMIDVVTLAEEFIAKQPHPNPSPQFFPQEKTVERGESGTTVRLSREWGEALPVLRGLLTSKQKPEPPILHLRSSAAILNFVNHPQLSERSQIGTATPDHVIRTKPWPLVLAAPSQFCELAAWKLDSEKKLATYVTRYRAYFEQECVAWKTTKSMLDPYPRVILIPELGLLSAAQNEAAAIVAADVYEHTITIITDAMAVGSYQPLGLHELFEMEYWSLEQAKLKAQKPKPCGHQVVLISGAANGIGKATAERFAREGAQLVLLDLAQDALQQTAQALEKKYGVSVLAQVTDITDDFQVEDAIKKTIARFGGLDIVVCNAGKAYSGKLAESEGLIRESFQLNYFAQQRLALEAVKVMQAQGYGGSILFNASKAAFNPGPEFGPYAIPKAAVIALMKQIALDYGADGIRSNAINADRIRTGLFGDGVLEDRLKKRGLTEAEYFGGNLLQQEVTADDVADAFYFLAQSFKTTGAVLPVDGGNIAAAPR